MVDIIQILIQNLFNFIQSQEKNLGGAENFDKVFVEALKDVFKSLKSDQISFQDIINELISQGKVNLENQDENSLKELISYLQKNFRIVQPSLSDNDTDSEGEGEQVGEKDGTNSDSVRSLFYINFTPQNLLKDAPQNNFSSNETQSNEGREETGLSYDLRRVRINGDISSDNDDVFWNNNTDSITQKIGGFEKAQNVKMGDISDSNNAGGGVKVENGDRQVENNFSSILKDGLQEYGNKLKDSDGTEQHQEKSESSVIKELKFKEKNDIGNKNGEISENEATIFSGKTQDNKEKGISDFRNEISKQQRQDRSELFNLDENDKNQGNIKVLSDELEKTLHQEIRSSRDFSGKSDTNNSNSFHLKSENLNFVRPEDNLKDIKLEGNLREVTKGSDQFQNQISQKIEEIKKIVFEAVRVSYGTFQKRAYVEANIFGSKIIVDVSLDPLHNVSISIATQDSSLRAEISKHQDDLQRFLRDNNFNLQSFNVGVDLDNKNSSENFVSYKDFPSSQNFYVEQQYVEKISRGTFFANIKGRMSFFA